MVRQLYRIYLYTVSIALLILATVGLGALLNTLLANTPLRGSYRTAPGQQEIVQSIVFAVTAWIIAGALGALHLWLIRRDIAEYPEAGGGGVRAFFLNCAEAFGALIVVIAGAGGFSTLAQADASGRGDSANSFATALATLLFVAVLELERRRYNATSGAATVFQRLHLFGIPLILVIVTTLSFWNTAMRTTVASVLIGVKAYNPLDPNACRSIQLGPIEGPCSLPNPWILWLAALVPIAAIVLYSLAARNDFHSLIRTIAHIASICVGVAALLFGLVRGVELLLRGIFGSIFGGKFGTTIGWSDIAHPWNASYDFISPLTVGVLLIVVYGLWLRAEKSRLPLGAQTTDLITEAVAAVIFAVAFWWGIGRVAYTALQWLGNVRVESYPALWANANALVVGGLAFIPLAIHLRRATSSSGNTAPRRGFVLAMLAGGTVTGAIGLTITLYNLGANLLGAPVGNWQQTIRGGLAALIVGIILVVSYGWTALQERSVADLFKRLKEATPAPKAPAPPAQAGAPSTAIDAAIEQVLTQYETHAIGLDEATKRLKALMRTESTTDKSQSLHV